MPKKAISASFTRKKSSDEGTDASNNHQKDDTIMKKTKRILAMAVLSAALCAAPMTTAFGFGWKNTKSEATADAEEVSYSFKTEKAVISIGDEAAPILKALGDPKKTFEQDSCAYQGKDKVYSYEGFDICTWMVDGKECVNAIYLMDGTVTTPEGVKIGSTKQDVINAYGKDYTESYGVCRYTIGNTELSFYMTNQVVDSIEYLLAVTK